MLIYTHTLHLLFFRSESIMIDRWLALMDKYRSGNDKENKFTNNKSCR